MKTIAMISRKGGSGKSTLTIHLAVAAQLSGLNVGIIDLDPQQSAAEWADEREEGPEVISGQATRLAKLLSAARNSGADLILIDTPASNADVPQIAAHNADLCLIPCRASKPDVASNLATHSMATAANKPVFFIFNDEPHRRASVIDELREVLTGRGVQTAPVVIKERVIFSESISRNATALELEPDGKAASEIRALFEWVIGLIDLKIGRPNVKSLDRENVESEISPGV
jgi:chromosome partitioning protein